MRKILICLIAMFLLSCFSVVALSGYGYDYRSMYLGNIRYDEYVATGVPQEVVLNVINFGDEDYDDVQVRTIIPDLGYMAGTQEFDLNEGDVARARFVFEIPSYAQPGDYYVRFTVSDDLGHKRIKHRLLTVVE